MEDNQRRVNFQRLSSEDSAISDDSCEYYQTDIYEHLPSTLSRWKSQFRDQAEDVDDDDDDDDYDDFEYVSHLCRDWNSIQSLKMLPLCMQEKRNIRERLHQQKLKIGHWESWRRSQRIAWRRMVEQLKGFFSRLLPWKHTLHKIEGRFGVGVKAYFVFLRYLLGLNLLNCVIIALSVLLPSLYIKKGGPHCNLTSKDNGSVLDVFLGSGFLERSPVFYSFYKLKNIDKQCLNTSLLFFAGMVLILLLSFLMIVRRTVVGYKHTWMTGNHFSMNMSYKVFCGWDFCIQDPQAAFLKHSFIKNELKMDLEEQRFRLRVSQRTLKQKVVLFFLRLILNISVLALLGGSFALIYYATIKSQNKLDNVHWTLKLLWEYLPPITITVVNFVLPQMFCVIVTFEDYSLTTQLNLTLVRSIFLKLASLGIYLFFLITYLTTSIQNPETEFGKEMYKLTIFHLLACFCNAFLVSFPRAWIVDKYPSSMLAKKIGKPEFVIPLNILDLVYSQTVTWVGVFYCPLLPAISIVKLLVIFYMKMFTVIRCCAPAQRMFRTTSSSVLFNFMLLLGLIMSAVTLGVNINMFVPGTCGPFMGDSSVFNVTSECVQTLPRPVRNGISYITSEAFAFALILAEVIILTSLVSRGGANRKTIERLKDMLVMCSSDKRFLVKQHATLIRRQRRIAPSTE
ncbi:transmembrane channel-like protein 7 isoform X1 [Astyanax mexicanus]|uniref:transmembrane channel-like protein 7 isoform X1 n=2 Tax=Astyanax mexicanus TaxID=7994 RepID=UPI0020CB5F48|nr:transmembrane channel-like protein 7 isoform X1 [Astyanax mexicanus]